MSVANYSWWIGVPSESRVRQDPVGYLAERGVNVPADTSIDVVLEALRIVTLLWCDDQIIPLDKFAIDPADEGLLFGRGVWESTRTQNGAPWLWPWHLDRLQKTAALLGIPVTTARLPDAAQVTHYVRSLTAQDVVIRLNVTAGRPGGNGVVWMSASLPPVSPASIRLKTVRNPVQNGQPYLLWKTFQYATRLRVGQQAAAAGYDSALLVDDAGLLLEASHANLFLKVRDGWITPVANGGLLPGTVRQFLLQKSPIPIREQAVPIDLLELATEVFVSNSNLGIVPVTQIDNRQFGIGEETVTLANWLNPPIAGKEQWRVVERQTPIR